MKIDKIKDYLIKNINSAPHELLIKYISLKNNTLSTDKEYEVLYEQLIKDINKAKTNKKEEIVEEYILQVDSGIGGQEALMWADDLRNMYIQYFQKKKYKYENVNNILYIKGARLSWLLNEFGVHRVQRVPKTEKLNRTHTSTAAVYVYFKRSLESPELDLEISTCRSSGAGGQNVNKRNTAVQIKDKTTGTYVRVEGRKWYENLVAAKDLMNEKINKMMENVEKEQHSQIRNIISSKDRNAKIRTYNYKENRITDHRMGKTVYNLSEVLNGQLDNIISMFQEGE